MRLLFHIFVVVVGTLILAGAVNTAIVGSNGVLNRVSEDGVLPDWFRQPHRRFGTSHRIINVVVIFQIITILISRGDVTFLANLYAFGVVWSFAMKGLAVLVLRFTHPGNREYRVPLNLKVGGVEFPVGLFLITLILLLIAIVNLFTKPAATEAGLFFSFALFALFMTSEKIAHHRLHGEAHVEVDQFNVAARTDLTPETVGARPGNVLVPISNYHALYHLSAVLDRVHVEKRDIVVLHVRLLRRVPLREKANSMRASCSAASSNICSRRPCLWPRNAAKRYAWRSFPPRICGMACCVPPSASQSSTIVHGPFGENECR